MTCGEDTHPTSHIDEQGKAEDVQIRAGSASGKLQSPG